MRTEPSQTNPPESFLGDIWGGLAAMLVALPSAIAFGVLVFTAIGPSYAGVGAMAGVLGTVALGLIAPLVSRNGGFITAPCAPAAAVMSALAGTLAHDAGLPFERVVALMALAALLSAALQLLYGVLRLGRLIKYIPYQVVSGYLSGVGLVIAVGQFPKLLGVPGSLGFFEGLTRPELWRWPGIVVGVVTIAVTFLAPRFTKRVPAAILGLTAGIACYFGVGVFVRELWVLDGNALVIGAIDSSGSVTDVFSKTFSSLGTLSLADVGLVAAAAVTLSALLSIDTLKTGVVLDALTHRRHNSNRELIGQGCANAGAALCGGMPGAGTMGATLVNVTSGGHSHWSGFIEGVLAAVAFLALRPVIAWVPIGALAGILLVVAFRMFDWHAFRLLLQPSTRLDFFVIASVIGVAKGVGLIQASLVGIGLAALIFIRNQVRGSVILRKRDLREVASKTSRVERARELLKTHGEQALLVELRDDLFFGTTDQLYTELNADLQKRRFILFDLRRVQSMDYTAGNLFNQMHQRLRERGGGLLLAGMPSGLASRQDIARYLEQLGLVNGAGGITICETRNKALELMESELLRAAGWTEEESSSLLELGEFELFREFGAAELDSIDDIVETVHLEAGEKLFSQGDQGDALFLVRRGVVEILLPLPEGKRHHLATMARGNYLGEMAFLDLGHRSADCFAKAETDLFSISRKRFNALALKDAALGVRVFARLAQMVSRRMRAADAEIRTLEER